jgi:hypothetical protein
MEMRTPEVGDRVAIPKHALIFIVKSDWTVPSSNPLSCDSLFSFREIVVTCVSVEDFPQVGVQF